MLGVISPLLSPKPPAPLPSFWAPSDLVAMYAHENMVNLTRYALPLEAYVRGEEERAASLEATLSPQYRAYGTYYPNISIFGLFF